VSDVEIFLAFPDGGLRYDCRACDQRCCKTGVLPLFPNERESIVRQHPALELVAPGHADGVALFSTPCSGCWFLADGRCTLADGAHLRPQACTLYPWNVFGRLGNALVVAPHPLCPLTVAPGRGVTHREVVQLIGRLGAAGGPASMLSAAHGPGRLVLERLVRDVATACLNDETPFRVLAFSQLAGQAFLDHGPAGIAEMPLERLDEVAGELEQRAARMARAGRLSLDGAAWAKVTPLFAAWLPSLRLFAFDEAPLHALPAACLALAVEMAHWQTLAPERALLPMALAERAASAWPRLGELVAVSA
jgi:hypothetical protein